MTFEELIDESLRMVGDDVETPQFFTRAEMGRRVNEAMQAVAGITVILQEIHHVEVIVGQSIYVLPEQAGQALRIAYDYERLPATTTLDLDSEDESWTLRTGAIDRYHVDGLDEREFEVWKDPDVAGRTVAWNGDVTGLTSWAISTYFTKSDVVEFAGQSYVCVRANISNIVTNSPISAAGRTFWAPLSELGLAVSLSDTELTFSSKAEPALASEDMWVDGTYYRRGDVVHFGTLLTLFVCVVSNLATALNAPVKTAEEWAVIEELGSFDSFISAVPSPVFPFSNELGTFLDFQFGDDNLEVWSERVPDFMVEDSDTPEIPEFGHITISYLAAAAALRKEGEAQNEFDAAMLTEIAGTYVSIMTTMVTQPTEEELHRPEGLQESVRRERFVRLPGNYPRWRHH